MPKRNASTDLSEWFQFVIIYFMSRPYMRIDWLKQMYPDHPSLESLIRDPKKMCSTFCHYCAYSGLKNPHFKTEEEINAEILTNSLPFEER